MTAAAPLTGLPRPAQTVAQVRATFDAVKNAIADTSHTISVLDDFRTTRSCSVPQAFLVNHPKVVQRTLLATACLTFFGAFPSVGYLLFGDFTGLGWLLPVAASVITCGGFAASMASANTIDDFVEKIRRNASRLDAKEVKQITNPLHHLHGAAEVAAREAIHDWLYKDRNKPVTDEAVEVVQSAMANPTATPADGRIVEAYHLLEAARAPYTSEYSWCKKAQALFARCESKAECALIAETLTDALFDGREAKNAFKRDEAANVLSYLHTMRVRGPQQS